LIGFNAFDSQVNGKVNQIEIASAEVVNALVSSQGK
jgi:hypothetical protein